MKTINTILAPIIVVLVGLPVAAVIKLTSGGKPAADDKKSKENPWRTANLKAEDFRQAMMPEVPGEKRTTMSRREKAEVAMQRFFRSQEYRDDIAALDEKSRCGHTYSEEYSDDQLLKLYNNITVKRKRK